MLKDIVDGGVFLLNTMYGKEEVFDRLPRKVQEQIIGKKLKLYVIDAYKVAKDSGMGGRINTVMQVCFFAISGVLPREEAIHQIKYSIEKTYGKKGEEIVEMNLRAVDNTLDNLFEVQIPSEVTNNLAMIPPVPDTAPDFVRDVLGMMIARRGDEIPVSAMPIDGTYPTGTTQWEKRNIAQEIPVWDPNICIQCGKCALVCPHSVIRIKVYEPALMENAPETFKLRQKTAQAAVFALMSAPPRTSQP
jgi:pyruvate-ferredoxin/flavodoxin oxidoreductase